MIYFDNAATTLYKPQEVMDAVLTSMKSSGNAGRGVNEASLSASRVIYQAREALCDLFNGEDPRQIVFTMNSTHSLNMAMKGLLRTGDHVITTVLEHNSVLRPLYELEQEGIELTILPCDALGRIEYEEIPKEIKKNTKAIVTTHGSNLTGNLLDIHRIGGIAREYGITYIVDASQTAGVYPIDVKASNIDILCFTGHKGLLGPQGTGGMYVRGGLRLKPLLSGGTGVQTFSKEQPAEMPTHLEAGTLNGHGIAGLLAGVEYINKKGMSLIREKEMLLMKRFYEGIKEIEGITFYGDYDTEIRCPIVTFNYKDYDSGEVADELLERYGVVLRAGGHCAPLMHESFGTVEQGALRFSFSHMNEIEEVDKVIQGLKEMTTE
ncbi:cysteine desulfurase family protein [Aequitasia blattaphilus]|uniref:cysteine desulfurase n=1 Tax=Aequitasia blattaphilus TaxID=2949332 RepID=A0ABT1EAM8_9FIRM|nr:aminotransferase class V-fold PLP-dependent enzyme [Aequitasia blattaphilus]MCP1102890.1 aminotransferase class V-fold PLP-dependent enzyme [Aequitasia blattaphilus]MCR8615530.1 aminotransferase class V-fold PLP-dependent enzyme [Aequitasia blattaphilus]